MYSCQGGSDSVTQYKRYKPRQEDLEDNRPRALLQFAGNAILDGVRERHRKWTWAYFMERRDDRHRYVELFKKKQLNAITIQVSESFLRNSHTLNSNVRMSPCSTL